MICVVMCDYVYEIKNSLPLPHNPNFHVAQCTCEVFLDKVYVSTLTYIGGVVWERGCVDVSVGDAFVDDAVWVGVYAVSICSFDDFGSVGTVYSSYVHDCVSGHICSCICDAFV